MTVDVAYTGPLAELSEEHRARLVDRAQAVPEEVCQKVERMAPRIRERGDDALRAYTERFDDVELEELTVPEAQLDAALQQAPAAFLDAFDTAVQQVQAYHEHLAARDPVRFQSRGVQAHERAVPLERAGVYVPGGTAAYPSTVAMTVVPARAAGVEEITVATPPASDGTPSPLVLAACRHLGIDRVLAIGGAQAILGLAYGTQTVPEHDAVVGPGNVYVQAAKRHVAGSVRIDAPAGPSEVAVLADAEADPGTAARELVAQAEHDPRALAVALCEGEEVAKRVHAALDEAIAGLPRADVVEEALASRGAVLSVDEVERAVAFLDDMAPEHCVLLHRDGERLSEQLAGPACIVAGLQARVPLTDYVAGPSHVLPTGGHARAHSGINVDTFTKRVHVSQLGNVDEALVDAAVELARLEGFEAHANALEERP